jgi:type IV pilus assembly protein PilB
MAIGTTPGPTGAFLGGLARRLVTDGLLTEERAREIQQKAVKSRESFVSLLVQDKVVPARKIADTASREFGIPLIDVLALDLANAPIKEVSEKLIRDHRALPVFVRGKRMFVALSDPTNLQALDEIKFNVGMATEPVLVEEDKLNKAIDQALSAVNTTMEGLDDDADLDNVELSAAEDSSGGGDVTSADAEETPIVRFVNKMLLDAIQRGASDIHFEPYEKNYRVRYRTDGVLQEISAPPVALGMRLAARLKVLARLDLAERRIPQDGRIKLNLSKSKSIDFRVSTCPTLFGEKVVLRINDASAAQMGIDSLGYDPHQKELYLKALARPQGMILVTGPTGSGKTVSLYAGLNILNTPDTNISTAEDPAEINLPGANQVNVNPKVGLTFASALRAFLRQDPDVIMVGEIRDLETAEIAIKAAQTGHLVLSTLHTNDAPQTLTRLLNMGVPAYNIASSVSLIIAQRLARRLCKVCKRPTEIPAEELIREGFKADEISSLELYEPVGCDQCNDGFKGRVGIYQVMPVTEAIGRIIMEGGNAIDIADQAKKDGVNDLRASGLQKVREGMTSLAEVNSVTVD